MARNIHVTPNPSGGWQVKREGVKTAIFKTQTQLEAIEVARESAKRLKIELIIHRPNGQIRNKDSFGNDPYPPKDK